MTYKNTYTVRAERPKERILHIEGTLTESQARRLYDLLGPTNGICYGLYSALDSVLELGATSATEEDTQGESN